MRILPLILAAAVAASPAFAGWSTITSEAQLKKLVVGKSYLDPKSGAWFKLRRNGKLTGAARKEKLTGVWQWKDKYVCFDRALGGKKLPGDCIIIQVDGPNIATIRQQGKGRKTAYVPK